MDGKEIYEKVGKEIKSAKAVMERMVHTLFIIMYNRTLRNVQERKEGVVVM
jgi:hypothetical protein